MDATSNVVPLRPTVDGVITKLREGAARSLTAGQWPQLWLPLLNNAELDAVSVDTVLEELVRLGVGKKQPLKATWKAFHAEQKKKLARAVREEKRAKSGKVVVSVDAGVEQVVKRIEQVLVEKADPEYPLIRDANGYISEGG